ncbi:MAG: extracellular solute-binding protein [Clostridiales bacterium]|nr:extracellular solute-binding protein [Clostridiales bacterium]
MKKRIPAIILAALLACASFAACGEAAQTAAPSQSPEAPAGQEAGDAPAAAEAEETTTQLQPELPDENYGGREFTIMQSGNWTFNDFDAEEETGEPINDAKYRRQVAVEEKLGVKINAIAGAAPRNFSTAVTAGDQSVTAGMIGTYDVSSFAQKGLLMNLNSVPWLDLTKPWWDQKANEDLSMKGIMFYTTGDFTRLTNDCTYCILFNKTMIKDYGLDDPYGLVNDSKWTIEKMGTMVRVISKDVNGDGKMGDEDMYGWLVWDDSFLGMTTATGEKCCTINGSGELELTLNTPRVLREFELYSDFAYDTSCSLSISANSDVVQEIFASDRGLFYGRYILAVSWFRDMETDFGILPYPKLEETQDKYYINVHPYGTSFFCVPISSADPAFAGAVMEALSAESHYTLRPAYYETTLVGKYVRDDESSAMLDLIFANRVFDIGFYYQVGGYNEGIMNLWRAKKTDFMSMYNKAESRALSQIDKINAAFAEALANG